MKFNLKLPHGKMNEFKSTMTWSRIPYLLYERKNLNKTEPMLLIENFLNVNLFFRNHYYSKNRNKIIFFFSICVLLFLIKKEYYLEARFFLFRFCANIFRNTSILSSYKILMNDPKNLKSNIIYKFLKKEIIFVLKFPGVLKKFNLFYEKLESSLLFEKMKTSVSLFKMLNKNKSKNLIAKKKFGWSKSTIKQRKIFEKQKNEEKIDSVFKSKKCYQRNIKYLKIIKIRSKNANLINCVDQSFDNKTITIGYQNSLIHVCNLRSNLLKKKDYLLKGHSSSIFCAKKTRAADYILSTSFGGEIYLWALKQKILISRYQTPRHSIWDFDLNKNRENFVSVGSLGFGLYWHIERPFPLRFFHGHISDVNTIKWHSDINFLATGSDDKTVRLWDIRIKKSIGKISFDAPVNSVEFSHDGKDLTIAGKSRFIDTIDIRTLKSRFKIREEALKIDKICYLDEREFAYVKDSESVKIWGEYGKRRENYFKTNNFTNFKSVKVISDIHRIMQLKTDKLNKMTIVGLNL